MGITMTARVLSATSGLVLIVALAAVVLDALPAMAQTKRHSHILVSDITKPPPGWEDFCAHQPNECVPSTNAPRKVALSRKSWMELARVNKRVNKTIKPLTDLEHWHVLDRWSYPDDGYGDCEDYVLLKRRMLIQAGWPSEMLLITVVRDKNDQGHAVLTVTTDTGDYVLDNQNDEILLWSQTDYHFVKRQSQSNPRVWVSLGDRRPAITTAASSKNRSLYSLTSESGANGIVPAER